MINKSKPSDLKGTIPELFEKRNKPFFKSNLDYVQPTRGSFNTKGKLGNIHLLH